MTQELPAKAGAVRCVLDDDFEYADRNGLFYAVLELSTKNYHSSGQRALMVMRAIDAALADLDANLIIDRKVWNVSWSMQEWSATNARDGLSVRVRWLSHGAWQGAFRPACFGREDWLHTRDCAYPYDAVLAAFEGLRVYALERRLLAEKIEGVVAVGVVEMKWDGVSDG